MRQFRVYSDLTRALELERDCFQLILGSKKNMMQFSFSIISANLILDCMFFVVCMINLFCYPLNFRLLDPFICASIIILHLCSIHEILLQWYVANFIVCLWHRSIMFICFERFSGMQFCYRSDLFTKREIDTRLRKGKWILFNEFSNGYVTQPDSSGMLYYYRKQESNGANGLDRKNNRSY